MNEQIRKQIESLDDILKIRLHVVTLHFLILSTAALVISQIFICASLVLLFLGMAFHNLSLIFWALIPVGIGFVFLFLTYYGEFKAGKAIVEFLKKWKKK